MKKNRLNSPLPGSSSGRNPLWTRDFTIITAGSVVSMVGNALSGFAMSLYVLDLTRSDFLYGLYMFLYTLPQAVAPLLSGPMLDRLSRKRVVYGLDFLSSGIYLFMGILVLLGWVSFPVLAVATFFVGAINSTYTAAYGSLYPLLITEGNYDKAYSVSSILETISFMCIPLAALVYSWVGIAPLFIFNGISFLTAAIMETKINVEEPQLNRTRESTKSAFSQLSTDFRAGLRYLKLERGLLCIVGYFFFAQLAAGAASTITLPFFELNVTFGPGGKFWYIAVWGLAMLGRLVGGAIQYRIKIPAQKKFALFMAASVGAALLEGTYMYVWIGAMFLMTLGNGLFTILSFNIRLAGTQNRVPNDLKGRFNGVFTTISTLGMAAGQLLSAVAVIFVRSDLVLSVFMAMAAIACVLLVGMNKKHVAPILNTDA